MNAGTLILSELNGLLSIELHRPNVRNAFNPDMIQELTEAFQKASKRKEISAILLVGSGSVFCAGADLSWMQDMVQYTRQENLEDSQKLHQMFLEIWNCPHPILAYAHGAVYGGGLGLLACCDLVVADPATQFCFSEVKLGLSPAVISDFFSKKGLLPQVSSAMIFGNVFSTDEAINFGLAQKSETWENPKEKSLDWILKNGTEAMRLTKNLLRQLPHMRPAESRTQSTELISDLRVNAESQKRLKAFLSGAAKKATKS